MEKTPDQSTNQKKKFKKIKGKKKKGISRLSNSSVYQNWSFQRSTAIFYEK